MNKQIVTIPKEKEQGQNNNNLRLNHRITAPYGQTKQAKLPKEKEARQQRLRSYGNGTTARLHLFFGK